jgi:aminoglycoside/choline kinase family phosphotransferase
MSERLEQARRWLRRALGVEEIRLEPASGDASFRRYFRVTGGEKSLVLMDAPPDREDCAPFIAVAGLLRDAGVHVPEILARDLEQGFVLLEDLGEQAYLDVLRQQSANALYADALDTLVTMQSRVPPTSVPPYAPELVMGELELFSHWFLGRHLGIRLSPHTRRRLDGVCAYLREHFLRQPRVFVHRDYHSRNLMRCETGNPGVLDFQDAVAGPAVYDPVSLFRDVYLEWPREQVRDWLIRYHRLALDADIALDADVDGFLRDVDMVGAQRHLKVAGIFCRLYHRDAKSAYLRDIPLTLRYLVDECARHAELEPVAEIFVELDLPQRLLDENTRILKSEASLEGSGN